MSALERLSRGLEQWNKGWNSGFFNGFVTAVLVCALLRWWFL